MSILPRPQFTLITSTLNSESTLERCLSSIEAQTGAAFEHLIADGASTDGTLAIVERFSERYPLRLICSRKDSGIYQAWNRAANKALGQWILFLGSDDFLVSSDILSRVAEILTSNSHFQSLSFLYGDSVSPDEIPCWGDYRPNRLMDYLRGSTLFPTSVFFNAELFLRGHSFDESYRICADHKFFAQHNFFSSCAYLPIPILNFEAGGISSNPKFHRLQYRERCRLLDDLGRPRPWYTEWYYWLRSHQLQSRHP